MKVISNQRSRYIEIAMWVSVIMAVLMFGHQLLQLPVVVLEMQDYPHGFESIAIDYKSVHNRFLITIADMGISGTFLIAFGLRRWRRRLSRYAVVAFWVYILIRLAVYFVLRFT